MSDQSKYGVRGEVPPPGGIIPPQGGTGDVMPSRPCFVAAALGRCKLINPAGSGMAMTVLDGDTEIAYLMPGSWVYILNEYTWLETSLTPENEQA